MSLPTELLEFQNGNAYRSFPIRETTTQTSTDGLLAIPTDFMVDMLCAVGSDITKRYFISSISISSSLIVVSVGVDSALVGTFSITPSSNQNTVVYFAPATGYAGATGMLTVGTTDSILGGPNGVFYFTLADSEFEARCFVPSVASVPRLVFTDANGNTNSVSGDVVVQAGLNMRYELINSTTVRLNAGDGLGLNKACSTVAPPIVTINGVAPDSAGNFVFDADGCATLTTILNGILLSSTCAEPCMGCSEISELISRVIVVENNLISLRNTYQALLSEYQALQQALTCSC